MHVPVCLCAVTPSPTHTPVLGGMNQNGTVILIVSIVLAIPVLVFIIVVVHATPLFVFKVIVFFKNKQSL